MSTLRRLPEASELTWLSRITADATVPIERNDLLELLGNLLDNARKFAKSQVTISFADRCIFIEDDGPGVADAELSSIRQRGRKLDESRKGFGLGLAIVEDIADLYELELCYGRAANGGLQIKIAFDSEGASG